jgi:hypothetical protein
MVAERAMDGQCCGSDTAGSALEDLVPIAAVIGAGCEPCAATMVERALRRGRPGPLIERTLGIVAQVGRAECFAAAVGVEVVDRMRRSLRAGREALGRREAPGSEPTCRS